MKYRIYLIHTLLLTACGNPVAFNMYSVPGEVAPYVDRFKAEIESRRIPHNPYLIVGFGDMPGLDGKCTLYYDGSSPTITIDTSFWQAASYGDRLETVYHELGHCWLNIINHDDELFNSGMPKSVMHAVHFDGAIFMANYDYYMDQEVWLAYNWQSLPQASHMAMKVRR